MKNLKNLFSGLSDRVKIVFRQYFFTMLMVLFTVSLAALFVDRNDSLLEKALPFTFLWGTGAYFAETYFPDKKLGKWCGIFIAGLAAAGLTLMYISETESVKALAEHLITAYAAAVLMLGIFRNYKRSELPFNKYCLRSTYRLSQTAAVCVILAAGLALVVSIFITLLMNEKDFMLIIRLELMVMGCLAGFGILDAQMPDDRETAVFFSRLLRLMLGLVIAAFVIVYIYMLKILISRIVPSNEIFRILAGLFLIGLPVWTMTGALEEDLKPVKAGKILPYFFIPFLFLQGYAIGTRISEFGITPMRYLCLVLMLFEILYIIVYAAKKGETGIMLPVIAALAVVSLAVPYINMYSISARSQKAILDSYDGQDFETLPVEERSRLAGAYYYLSQDTEGKKLLETTDSSLAEAISSSGMIGEIWYDQNLHIYEELPAEDINISSYSRVTLVKTDSFDFLKTDNSKLELQNTEFYDSDGETAVTANIREYISECIRMRRETESGSGSLPDSIALEDGSLIRVLTLYIEAEPNDEISNFSITGLYFRPE